MKWFTVKEKMPKDYKDYLVLREDGLMEVCFGRELKDGGFLWDTNLNVLHYAKLPNSPRGTNIVKLKKDFDIKMEQDQGQWE